MLLGQLDVLPGQTTSETQRRSHRRRPTSQAPIPLTTTGIPGASDLIHSISLHFSWASCDGIRLETAPRVKAEPVGAGLRSARPVTCRLRLPSCSQRLRRKTDRRPHNGRINGEPYRVSAQLGRLANMLFGLGSDASVPRMVLRASAMETAMRCTYRSECMYSCHPIFWPFSAAASTSSSDLEATWESTWKAP